jgi:hypothetical protein
VRVLICGGRNLDEVKAYETISFWITVNYHFIEELIVIHGGAAGADTAAGRYARQNGFEEVVFEADWKRYGKAAGMIRNKKMLTEGQPDVILALSGGTGTANMIKIGREAGIPVFEMECK